MSTEANTRHLPKGTLAELKLAKLDPATHGCCHPNAAIDGETVMGCMVEKSCPFAQRKFGGFKGDGPEYVGYYHRTTRADEGKQHENILPCFAFVQTMLRRMRKGMADKEEGRDYEHVEIIALPKRVLERAAARGDRSLANKFGTSVVVTRWTSEVPKSLVNMRLVPETVELEVPDFPRPQDNPGITHTQRLMSRAAARELARSQEDEPAAESREERLARIKAELEEMDAQLPAAPAEPDAEPDADADAPAEMPEPSGETPVAEPVVRKRG